MKLKWDESTVRKQIIDPMLKHLGYGAEDVLRIVSEPRLKHPFTMYGSSKVKLHIQPDYALCYQNRTIWILEIKHPEKPIDKEEYIQQAFSYAIHREVQCPLFALCNGQKFALYSIRQNEPILEFEMAAFEQNFQALQRYIVEETNAIAQSNGLLAPDLGFSLIKRSMDKDSSGEKTRIELKNFCRAGIYRIENDLFTTQGFCEDNGVKYCYSADMGMDILNKLLTIVPAELAKTMVNSLNSKPHIFQPTPPAAQTLERMIGVGVVADEMKISADTHEQFVPIAIRDIIQA